MRYQLLVAAGAVLSLAVAAPAQQRPPAGPMLGLQDALDLITTDQPRIEAFQREADASEQAAVAARSLPDPQVTAGIQNYPVTGLNAPSPTRDQMTMYTIGVMREQVRRSKREAAAQKILADALVNRAERT